MTNRQAPSLVGVQLESANYQIMGVGLTDRIFLLGYGDMSLNDPYQVIDIQAAINTLQANTDAPLLRALIEAYYAGARDIYLVSVGRMVEFVTDSTQRASVLNTKTSAAMQAADANWSLPEGYSSGAWDAMTFYQRNNVRIQQAYNLLADWDLPQIIVPLNAPYFNGGGVDFLTPLATHCLDHFDNTGSICMGFMGSQLDVGWTDTTISEVEAITPNFGGGQGGYVGGYAGGYSGGGPILTEGAKFVAVFLGEGSFNFKQFPVSYSSSPVSAIAGLLSNQTLDQGVTWKTIPNLMTLTGPNLSQADMDAVAEAGLNPIVRTAMGRRGDFFQVVPATDNTLALNGSDYWSLLQMRMIMKVVDNLRTIGRRYLGSIGYGQAKLDMQKYLLGLVIANVIRGFTLNISKKSSILGGETDTMVVDVALQPYFGLRELNFVAFVGPGA